MPKDRTGEDPEGEESTEQRFRELMEKEKKLREAPPKESCRIPLWRLTQGIAQKDQQLNLDLQTEDRDYKGPLPCH